MSRPRVSFAANNQHRHQQHRRVPVADEAWGNEDLDDPPTTTSRPAADENAAPTLAAARRPLLPPPFAPPIAIPTITFPPSLRALCLTALAQHTFLLADAADAADDNEDSDLLRRAAPCSDGRLALAAAATRRGELSRALFLALVDPSWPVLFIGERGPPVQAVVHAARSGLLSGLRAVEWVLPSSVAAAEVAQTSATTTTTTPRAVLLPSEGAAAVSSLTEHCRALEQLVLRRADPARPARPAIVAAVTGALMSAALPSFAAGGRFDAAKRQEEDQGEEEEEEDDAAFMQGAAAPDSWEEEDAAPAASAASAAEPRPQQQQQQQQQQRRATFGPAFRLLRWEDLPDAAARAMAARCPRIALDRSRGQAREATATAASPPARAIDAPWLACLAPGWDDRTALLAARREEDRARRRQAAAQPLLVLVEGGRGGAEEEDVEEEEEQDGGADAAAASLRAQDQGKDGGGKVVAGLKGERRRGPDAGESGGRKITDDNNDHDGEDDSIAARFRRAYAERAMRLAAVERAKEAQRRRREVRASPALKLVERWLDEPV